VVGNTIRFRLLADLAASLRCLGHVVPNLCRNWAGLGILIVAIAGCADTDGNSITLSSSTDSEASSPLIGEELRFHYFGVVVSKPDLKLKHSYRLDNTSNHDIKVVQLVNRQPCCGEVRIGKTMLHPGDATDVEVTLTIKQEFGDIVHNTVVFTEPAQSEELILQTMAKAYPQMQIEETTPANGMVLLSSDKPKLIELRVIAYGTSAERPIDLNRVELLSAIKVDWLGPKEKITSEGGLTIERRRFTAALDPAGPPGRRKDEIVLQNDKRHFYTHIVGWEAVCPITASPKMIVMKAGEGKYRVLVQSRDQKLFRITRIECNMPGVQGRSVSTASALSQSVEVEGQAPSWPESRRGLITVFTDHPAYGKLDLPFVVID